MTVFATAAPEVTNIYKHSPATRALAVTKSDTDTYVPATRGLYIGGGGDVAVILAGDTAAVTFTAVPTGTVLPICCTKIMSTNTTATNIVALS